MIAGALVHVGNEARIDIPLRPVCDHLRLDWSSQPKRINRDRELESRMGKAAHWAKGIERRVTTLELRLEGDEAISEAQAAELALAVKNMAHLLESQSTANSYRCVYRALLPPQRHHQRQGPASRMVRRRGRLTYILVMSVA